MYATSHQQLTRREEEILAAVSTGLIDKEIAARAFISPETVRQHIKNIYKKLGVRNRVEASMKYVFELRSYNYNYN